MLSLNVSGSGAGTKKALRHDTPPDKPPGPPSNLPSPSVKPRWPTANLPAPLGSFVRHLEASSPGCEASETVGKLQNPARGLQNEAFRFRDRLREFATRKRSLRTAKRRLQMAAGKLRAKSGAPKPILELASACTVRCPDAPARCPRSAAFSMLFPAAFGTVFPAAARLPVRRRLLP